jgi:Zn-dependent protease with chaperone function
MEFAARYQDGLVAEVRNVHCVIDLAADPVALVILDGATREVIDRWPESECYLLHSRMVELRIANRQKPAGARLAVNGIADTRAALRALPALVTSQGSERWRQVRILVPATAALACVLVAYLFGIPLAAGALVTFVPPAWETKIGDTAAAEIERQMTGGKGYVACDANPDSPANKAIAGFVDRVFDGLGSPFRPTVLVVRSDIPNAFALPGGRAFYLSSLIQASRTPDEFAGVLAHELGHVYHRHGMQTLIANSTTGLLVGFVLGDMTGLSAAAFVGSSLIQNRFSRQDEAEADRFAAETAKRLGFSTRGLADLLERVARDDSFSRAFALFSNHPLTDERRAALTALSAGSVETVPAFTDAAWQAIRDMCPPPPPPPLPRLSSAL